MTNNRTESGPLEDSSGPIAGDAKDFAIAALEEKVRRLREALKEMVDEKCDYMRINNLGDPEQTHTVKLALAAINNAEGIRVKEGA